MNKSSIIGFHHVCIKAQNFEQTVQFYQSLGFQCTHSWSLPDFNVIKCTLMHHKPGNVYIEICDKNSDMPTQGRERDEEEEFVENALQHICFIVENAELAYKNAIANGAKDFQLPITINLKSKIRQIEVRNSLVYSPNGEVIEFIESDPFISII